MTDEDCFHRLWTASLSSRIYDKEAWKNVERQLLDVGVIGSSIPVSATSIQSLGLDPENPQHQEIVERLRAGDIEYFLKRS